MAFKTDNAAEPHTCSMQQQIDTANIEEMKLQMNGFPISVHQFIFYAHFSRWPIQFHSHTL